jgi:hypothetical protein
VAGFGKAPTRTLSCVNAVTTRDARFVAMRCSSRLDAIMPFVGLWDRFGLRGMWGGGGVRRELSDASVRRWRCGNGNRNRSDAATFGEKTQNHGANQP